MGLPKQQSTATINDCIVEHMYIVEQEARKIASLIPDGFDYFVAQATNQSVGIGPTEG